MAFPTTSLTNNRVHKEGNRSFVYDSATGVWDRVREADNSNLDIQSGNIGPLVTGGAGLVTTPLSHRNLIINGDMTIAQRGTSSTATGVLTVDRIGSGFNTGTTQSQSDVVSGTDPYNLGFRKAFKLLNSGAAVAAGHYMSCYMYLEAQDMARCGWKYTDPSSYITLSFWIKSSVAGTFYGKITASDASKEWVFPFTLVADTWKKIEQTFPGNVNLQFDINANRGLEILIPPFYGTDFTASGATTGSWASYNGSARFPDMVQWGASAGATWEITGMQLEVGSTATPFEHRPYGDELAKCQRYYSEVFIGIQAGKGNGTTSMGIPMTVPVSMRATPSVALSGTSGFSRFNDSTTAVQNATGIGVSGSDAWNSTFYCNVTGISGVTDNRGYTIQSSESVNFTAEL